MEILQDKKFYLEQSGNGTAIFLERLFSKKWAVRVAWTGGVLSALDFFVFIFFLGNSATTWIFLGTTEIFFSIFLGFGFYAAFLDYLEHRPGLDINEIQRAIQQRSYGQMLNFPASRLLAEAGEGGHLLLLPFWNFIFGESEYQWFWSRLDIPIKELKQAVQTQYPAAAAIALAECLARAASKALGANHLQITSGDMLLAIFELDPVFQKILFDFSITKEDLAGVADWQRRKAAAAYERGKFWSKENLLNTKGIGKDWSAGYTLNLDQVARDLTAQVAAGRSQDRLYGRKNQVELLERMLVRSGSPGNVVIIGPPGVGKHTLLRALALRLNLGQSLGPLRYMRLLQIDSTVITSGAGSFNDVVGKIKTLFSEALFARNVILVVEDFDAFFDPNPGAGRLNASEALLPFLQSGLRIIGLTTPQAYQATIGKNAQLARLTSKLEYREPTLTETLLILEDEAIRLERRSGLWFSYHALLELLKLSDKLIQNLPNPEKALEILEETAVFAATKAGARVVLPEHVQSVVAARTKIPVEKVSGAEKDTLLNLESILHTRIVGQEEALKEIANALRRARSGIASDKRPIGGFLFLGPTGVGKTETTKALAAVYFGSENRIVRFDMSEFQEVHSINRLIGDADAGTGGLLTEAVLGNPFSLILLDEVEKAHPKILDLFLQVLDEGRLTDTSGRTVSFVNTLVIATSNAGAELVRQIVRAGGNPAESKEKLLDELQRQGIFRPEFLNRFDAVVIFRPLTEQELTQVASMLLREFNERLAEKEVQVEITPELARALARGGYSPEFGARPLRRFIQERIENYVAKGLISGEIRRGDVVQISPEALAN